MNVKKKGILRGFKYFSQIFDEEDHHKDIQIGMPTDVKHVAHIGWDGPSASAPSWMDEFKSANGGYQSAPLESSTSREDEDNKWNSEDKGHKSHQSNPSEIDTIAMERDMPALPKASRRHQSMDNIKLTDSPVGSPTTSSHRTIKNKDKDSKKEGIRRRKEKPGKLKEGSGPSTTNEEASSLSIPSIPKKSRRKKSKDPEATARGSSKLSSKRAAKNGSVQESEEGPVKSSAVDSCLEALKEE